MTGDLNSEIDCNPPFPGFERHFLRAQIARITHSTMIVPRDLFKTNEENDRDVLLNEDFAVQDTAALSSLENWIHVHPNVLQTSSRITHYIPTSLGEEEREEYIAKKNEEEPVLELLKGINEDVPLVPGAEEGEVGVPCWTSKILGDNQQYN
jgi:radial spoke head protein 4A